MKNLSLNEVKVVSGGISSEVFLATVAVTAFTLLAITIAENNSRFIVGYDRGYYYDPGWYIPSYSYSYYSPGYFVGYYY